MRPRIVRRNILKRRRLIVVFLLLLAVVAGFFLVGEAKNLAKAAYVASAPRPTEFPSSPKPDQVCLTWSGDPRTTQAIQWRTAIAVTEGEVQYHAKAQAGGENIEAKAESLVLTEPQVKNDPSIRHFTAELTGLAPATAYVYRVGNPQGDSWSEWAEFSTAPSGAAPFSFVYLGDSQGAGEDWGRLLSRANETRPETAFYVIAGDLVDNGNNHDQWDALLHAGDGLLARHPLVPCLGNHDCSGVGGPRVYLDSLALPKNGPETVAPERAYSFTYSNALFVVLDSNSDAKEQRPWLEKQLSGADSTWKFVIYHHPAYSSKAHRDNDDVRKYWCDLFDRYHVDMALQGHDHAYLRTHPMYGGQIKTSPSEGTVYVISVSGPKNYPQEQHDYTAAGFVKTSTYQIIDIDTKGGNKLTYRAYDADGKVRDELVIEKAAG